MSTEPVIARTGLDAVAERRRAQVEAHGYNVALDDAHDGGELVLAAIGHVELARRLDAADAGDLVARRNLADPPHVWPAGWTPPPAPSSSDEALANAGALIVAELDRRIRIAEAAAEVEHRLAQAIERLARITRTADRTEHGAPVGELGPRRVRTELAEVGLDLTLVEPRSSRA